MKRYGCGEEPAANRQTTGSRHGQGAVTEVNLLMERRGRGGEDREERERDIKLDY